MISLHLFIVTIAHSLPDNNPQFTLPYSSFAKLSLVLKWSSSQHNLLGSQQAKSLDTLSAPVPSFMVLLPSCETTLWRSFQTQLDLTDPAASDTDGLIVYAASCELQLLTDTLWLPRT